MKAFVYTRVCAASHVPDARAPLKGALPMRVHGIGHAGYVEVWCLGARGVRRMRAYRHIPKHWICACDGFCSTGTSLYRTIVVMVTSLQAFSNLCWNGEPLPHWSSHWFRAEQYAGFITQGSRTWHSRLGLGASPRSQALASDNPRPGQGASL
eukprot:363917-Chlamydomonas_euryale.AAC.4